MMLEQAERLGQQLPALQVHNDVLEACVRAGEADRDNSIIVEEIRRRRRTGALTRQPSPRLIAPEFAAAD